MVASPRKSAHSSKPLLDVIISEVYSDIEDTNPKNRFASAGVSGIKPTSSTITRAALRRYFSLRLLALEISTVFRIVMRLSSVSKATVYPRSRPLTARDKARWVFPTPGGPMKQILCQVCRGDTQDAAVH